MRCKRADAFPVLKVKAPKDIHEEFVMVLSNSALACATVKKWAALFKAGQENTKDDPHPGRPSTATNEINVTAVKATVTEDCRTSVWCTAAHLNLSMGSINTILHDHLGIFKVPAQRVSRTLMPEQKFPWKVTCHEMMALSDEDSEELFLRIMTQDEIWDPNFDPETKEKSKQWKNHKSPPPQKFKVTKLVGKVTVTVSRMVAASFCFIVWTWGERSAVIVMPLLEQV